MPKYYRNIDDKSELKTRSGASVVLPANFSDLSSLILRQCSFLQGLIQKIIYVTHGAELLAAKRVLNKFPNPKARMEFLSSFPYGEADPVISSVFNYSRTLFLEIYDLRNVLAHENWMSSVDFEDVVLFSELNEEAGLMMASGQLLHVDGTTPHQIYDATIRYIRSVKIVSVADINAALKDADLCAWILMTIAQVLDEPDPAKKEEIRKAYFVFRGTSHLFEGGSSSSGKVEVQSFKNKTIRG